MMYSEPRFTKDLGLWISVDPSNARAVSAALRDFGAPLSGLTEESLCQNGHFVYIKGRSDSDQAVFGSPSRPDRRGAVGKEQVQRSATRPGIGRRLRQYLWPIRCTCVRHAPCRQPYRFGVAG